MAARPSVTRPPGVREVKPLPDPQSADGTGRRASAATGRAHAGTGLADWARTALAPMGQTPARHHLKVIEELERLAGDDLDRLMILMPPGSAKSTYASVLYPAWWFKRHPASSVIAASHTAGFAEHLGRQARDLVAENSDWLNYRLAAGSRAAGRWQTSSQGQYFATGVRGSVIGRRADLVIVDDPVGSIRDAESAAARDRLWDWYRNTLLPRLKPRARVILAMTRWHEDDLAGRLLAAQKDEWSCLRLPALAEQDDPLGREIGAPLWPDWEDAAALERKRAVVGGRIWAAQYQQSPGRQEGAVFKVLAIQPMTPPLPEFTSVVRAWDLAATEPGDGRDPDWTVGLKLAREVGGRTVVMDVVRLRGSAYDVERAIRRSAELDGHDVAVTLPQDPGQAGKAQASWLVAVLAGYRATSSPESGSKDVRARPVAAQVEAGNVAMLQGSWNTAFIEELRDFPFGAKDDQVDALSRAFQALAKGAPPTRRVAVPHLGR